MNLLWQVEARAVDLMYALAHENSMTMEAFLDIVEEHFHVNIEDVTTVKVNEQGQEERVFENGDVAIFLDPSGDQIISIHRAAASQGITTNQFVMNSLEKVIEDGKE